MKQADLTGVEPVSDTAFMSAPCFRSNSTTFSFPDTAEHQRGVTICVDLSRKREQVTNKRL